jgi:KDO2-lipid IV(A) lauroyltransferase
MLVTRVIGRLPDGLAAGLGRRIGDVAFVGLRGRRRLALANLQLAFPTWSERDRRRLARRSFQHLGLLFTELCALSVRSLDRFLERVSVEGLEHLKGTMASHGRALVLTAHLGNWELLTAASRLTDYDLTVVVRPLDVGWLNALAEELRRQAGVELVDKRGALPGVLEALRRGRMVGILLDQNASRREGVFVPFFGHLASTSRAMAVLALRTRTPIVPVFARREAGARHRVVVQPPLEVPARSGPEALVELSARCTAAIEAAIRQTPDQWLWMHDRWRTRPPAP